MRLLLFFLIFILFTPLAQAAPLIENLEISPQGPWLGEDVIITLTCDDAQNEITRVFADIHSSELTLPTLDFVNIDNNYTLIIDSYLEEAGSYTANISCQNNESQTSSILTAFTISEFNTIINDISPSIIYKADVIEIDISVLKDNSPITSGVTFDLKVNNNPIELIRSPAYHTIRGWILKINSPNQEGIHNLQVLTTYNRASNEDNVNIEINNPLEFELISIEEFTFPDTNLTFTLRAMDRGDVIPLDKSLLTVKIDTNPVSITELVSNGDNYRLKIDPPDLPPGEYDLDLYLSYDGSTKYILERIIYPVHISGTITDQNDNGIGLKLNFQNNKTQKMISTNSEGKYDTHIPPGEYNLIIDHTQSKIVLKGVEIYEDSDYDDPIRYYPEAIGIPGIRTAAFYFLEAALLFNKAEIEMDYDQRKVPDERDLEVFACDNWNPGNHECVSEWYNINGEIDTVRNIAKINVDELSAYAIGIEETINIQADTDKGIYGLNEIITVTGLTMDASNTPLSNVSMEIKLNGENLDSIYSDDQGIFSFNFISPEGEGTYKIEIIAERMPYSSTIKTIELTPINDRVFGETCSYGDITLPAVS